MKRLKSRHFHALILLFLLVFEGFSQTDKIFQQDQFLWFVKNYHPMTRQANLVAQQGDAAEQSARGSFDPVLGSSINQKYYDDKSYYSLIGGGLVVPTWYGIEVKSGFDQTTGEFLNPQNNLPEGGLWYAGIKIPIGQGLFIDQRRTTLKQAQLFAEATKAEQIIMLNDLYYKALQSYWKWVNLWNKFQVQEESVKLAMERFEGVKTSFEFGDAPAIDTLEAFIQVQNRMLKRNESELKFKNQTLALSNFLWFENNTPLVVNDSLAPPLIENMDRQIPMSLDKLNEYLLELDENHPKLIQLGLKRDMLDLDYRLKTEMLKPQLDLKYNALTESVGLNENFEYSVSDYTWGLDFRIPILLRKERGERQIAKIKVQDIGFERQQTLLEIQNQVREFYNRLQTTDNQIAVSSSAVINYEGLLNGERQKFDAGESSVFLINSRENNYINSRLKLIDFLAEYMIYDSGVYWTLGILHEN